jgi:hypothetical protein
MVFCRLNVWVDGDDDGDDEVGSVFLYLQAIFMSAEASGCSGAVGERHKRTV